MNFAFEQEEECRAEWSCIGMSPGSIHKKRRKSEKIDKVDIWFSDTHIRGWGE